MELGPTSVLKLKSGLLEPAMAPLVLMRPPTNAPDPRDPKENKRRVLQGAIDSVSSLFRKLSSKPAFFFFSLLATTSDLFEIAGVCLTHGGVNALAATNATRANRRLRCNALIIIFTCYGIRFYFVLVQERGIEEQFPCM
jgi:hypothetical protein